ncbi:hypothetical protein BGX33_004383, partial [Mortierella sp. NVP41]
MDRGGVAYANRQQFGSSGGRHDYEDRHGDNGGYHGLNNSNNDRNGGHQRGGGGAGYNGGRGATWGQFNNGKPRNDSSQYPDRQSGSLHGSPPNSLNYDGPGRGEHRGSFGDSSAYRGHGNDDRAQDPSESLKAYQQSKSSDPYAVGLRSSAAFFHETYDKLERPGGFAD